MGSTRLYLGGGFKEETECADFEQFSDGHCCTGVHSGGGVILHSMYSVQNKGVERVIIYANDMDIITTCVYYAATLLKDLPELWVRTERENYLPIHSITTALGPAQCRALPFIHSLSGVGMTPLTHPCLKALCH